MSAAAPPSRPILRPLLMGAALALPFIPIFEKDYDRALDFLTLLLPFTAALYLGAALSGGSRRDVWLESLVAALVVSATSMGLWGSPRWIVAGYAAHAVWDVLHHLWRRRRTGERRWFPPFCTGWDAAAAAVLAWYT